MDSSRPLFNLAHSIFKSRRHGGGSFHQSSIYDQKQQDLAESAKSERDLRKNTVRIEKDRSVKFELHDHEKLLLVRKRSQNDK